VNGVSTHTSPYWAHTHFSSLIDSPDLAIDDYSMVLLATVLGLGFGREFKKDGKKKTKIWLNWWVV
jgi:hypothetical protein